MVVIPQYYQMVNTYVLSVVIEKRDLCVLYLIDIIVFIDHIHIVKHLVADATINARKRLVKTVVVALANTVLKF